MKITNKSRIPIAAIGVTCFIFGLFTAFAIDSEKIRKSMIIEAQKLTGLEFTDAEADSMLDNLSDFKNNYSDLRKLDLNNSVAPALSFNPIPAGYQFPDQINSFKTQTEAVALPKNRDDLAFYSVAQLANLIHGRKITSTELTKFFIARLKKYNPKLLFAITITEDLALKQAMKADEQIRAGKYKGILHGIPFGAKDLLAVKGYKTTWGSVPYKDQVIDKDATVIERLEAAGAILIAKTTLGELAMDDVWFGGKTRNPWDINRGSSGSSAGSASAVSAGCLPFAIGSETWGSITSPSTECGVTGLRPTFGRVPKTGAMALSWSMDKLGPIARTVEDCAAVFNAIKGPDGQDLSVIDAPFNYSATASLKGMKIGYLVADFNENDKNRANDQASLEKLKQLGAQLVPIELPGLPISAMHIILEAECGASFQQLALTNRDELMILQGKDAWPNIFRSAQFIPAVEYINANRARSLLIAQLNEKIKGLDAYMASAFSKNSLATNLTGHPCVVIPNGKNDKGLPASITFIGQLFGESKVLQIAQLYQKSTNFNSEHPPLNF